MYRSKEEINNEESERGGKSRKDNWFRKAGFSSTLCVSPTPVSKLAKQAEITLRTCPAHKETKANFFERGGSTVKQQLVSNNPFPKADCGRKECVIPPLNPTKCDDKGRSDFFHK